MALSDGTREPFTPSAFLQATNPSAVIGYGINVEEADTPSYPLDANECGLLVRLGPCSLPESVGGGTPAVPGTFSTSKTVSVPVGSQTVLLPANADRMFLMLRNHGPNTIYVGPGASVSSGAGAAADGGCLLQPGETYELRRNDHGITDQIRCICPSGASPSIVYVSEA